MKRLQGLRVLAALGVGVLIVAALAIRGHASRGDGQQTRGSRAGSGQVASFLFVSESVGCVILQRS